MANQNLVQKHARSFMIYATKLSETGYIGLFFLTANIYEKICLRKRPNFGKFNFQLFFLLQKTEDSQKLEFIAHNKCIEVILPGFFSSSISTTELSVLRSIHQYVTMATQEPISIFLCMVWVNMFAYDHNLPQDQIRGKHFLYHTTLTLFDNFALPHPGGKMCITVFTLSNWRSSYLSTIFRNKFIFIFQYKCHVL